MRYFATHCLDWAADEPNPSHRQTIIAAARNWARTAEAIDRQGNNVLPDLRQKLN